MTILDVVDMGFKVLCVVEVGLIAWGWRVWREWILMHSDEPKKLADLVEGTMKKEIQKAYNKGYTKGVQDGPKAKEVADELMGAAKLVVPQPCVRGIDMRTMKALVQKLNEEVDEFKFELFTLMGALDDGPEDVSFQAEEYGKNTFFRIAEEGADVATMIATICNAVGVDDKTRFEAQAYVNKHNQERGRL